MNNLSGFKSNTNHILKIFAAAAVILLVLSVNKINAQLDPTFGTNGVAITSVGTYDKPIADFFLADGKILVVIGSYPFNTQQNGVFSFVRYDANGVIDPTYGSGGIASLPISFNNSTHAIVAAAKQPDGKIILAGQDGSNGIILRFNEDGTLDTSFANGGVHRPNINQSGNDHIRDVVVLADGKILVCGFSQINNPGADLYLLRYTSNGLLDESFGNDGYIVHHVPEFMYINTPQYMFVQSSGKIVILSSPTTTVVSTPGWVRRYNADGTTDNSFSTISIVSRNYRRATMQPDDKIIIASRILKNDALERQNYDTLLTRYNADGSLDTNFGTGGQTSFDVTNYFDDLTTSMLVLSNGDILVAVSTEVQPNRGTLKGTMLSLAKLTSAGAVTGKMLVTNAYNLDGFDGFDFDKTPILIQPDGKILLLDNILASPPNGANILLARVVGVPSQIYKLHGVPFDFNYQLTNQPTAFDGAADVAVFRPSDRKWYFGASSYFFGLSDDIPVSSDYIADFSADLAMFRPSNGTWYIAKTYLNAATNYIAIQWGLNGDIPAPADYDGDGKSDLVVFRPSNGVWYIRTSADNSFTIFQWGLNGDKPVPGDYDGDGRYDVGVFRPSDGNWYILRSSDGQPYILHFGMNGDIPVQEDYDGDGKFDIAVYRPSEGVWYRLNSSDLSFFAMQWGIPSDIPTPADYDGDHKADIAVWRQTNGRWYVFRSSDAAAAFYNFGLTGDIPLARRQ